MNSRLADPSGATSRPSGSSGWLVLVGSSPYPVSFDQNPASRYGSEQSKVMVLIRTVIQWLLAKEAHPRSRCQHTERFSSCDLTGLKDMDGFGELPGTPGAAAEFAQDAPGLELGVGALAG